MSIEQGNQTQGPADTKIDSAAPADGGEKSLSLRDSLEANYEIDEKGQDSPDLSTAAKTLASARKGKAAPIDKVDDKTLVDSERVGKENAAKAKREAELAALAPEERAKAEAEDKRKSDEAAAAAGMEAPAHWPSADKEMFSKQAPEAKRWLLGRHQAMEADYTKKTQALSTTRKLQDELQEIFKDYREEMALNGVTEGMAIRQLVAAHAQLQRNPAQGMKFLAEKYGIELKSLVEGAAAADPAGESPTVKALRHEVSQLTGQLTKLTGAQDQQHQHARISEVTQFAEEKDDQGNLKRPHFDEVSKDIVRLINGARAVGEQIGLQDAYDAAVRANPNTHAKWLAARDAERKAKDEAERKAKADAAKKAGFDVKGEGAAAAGAASNTTLRDSLEKAWDAQEGRV